MANPTGGSELSRLDGQETRRQTTSEGSQPGPAACLPRPRAIDDPVKLARAARIIRMALARQHVDNARPERPHEAVEFRTAL